jgi:hypothetical protein
LRLFVSLLLVVLAGSTAFIRPSSEVLAKQAEEHDTLAKSEELNAELEKVIEKFERELSDPMERELLQADKLREWMKELRSTKDLKEAMRQYAALERKVAQLSSRLDQRRDEQLLAQAGEALREEADHRELGKSVEDAEVQGCRREAAPDAIAFEEAGAGFRRETEALEKAEVCREAHGFGVSGQPRQAR